MHQTKRILITGGHGFIGTRLTKMLRFFDHTVTTVDAVAPKLASRPNEAHIKDVSIYLREIQTATELPNLYEATEPYDVIVHLAATMQSTSPEATLDNNMRALTSVLGYCRTHPTTRLIFASAAGGHPTAHHLSKQLGEQLVRHYATAFGVDAVVVRFFHVYGPGGENTEHSRVLTECKHALMQKADASGLLGVVDDFVHVDDVVRGIVAIVCDPTPAQQYELGSAAPVTVQMIIDAFASDDGLAVMPPCASDDDLPSTWPVGWSPSYHVITYLNSWVSAGYPDG